MNGLRVLSNPHGAVLFYVRRTPVLRSQAAAHVVGQVRNIFERPLAIGEAVGDRRRGSERQMAADEIIVNRVERDGAT